MYLCGKRKYLHNSRLLFSMNTLMVLGSYIIYRRRTGLQQCNKTYVTHGYKYTKHNVNGVYTKETDRKSFPPAGIASSKGIERKWDSNLTSKAYWGRVLLRTSTTEKRKKFVFLDGKKKKIILVLLPFLLYEFPL